MDIVLNIMKVMRGKGGDKHMLIIHSFIVYVTFKIQIKLKQKSHGINARSYNIWMHVYIIVCALLYPKVLWHGVAIGFLLLLKMAVHTV